MQKSQGQLLSLVVVYEFAYFTENLRNNRPLTQDTTPCIWGLSKFWHQPAL